MGQDISYYVFQRPFLNNVCETIRSILIFNTVYTFAVYSIGYLRTDFISYKGLFGEKRILNHLLVCVLIYFISLAASFKFSMENLFFGEFGNLNGAGFTDIMVWLNFYKFTPVILIGVVIISYVLFKQNKIKVSFISLGFIPFLWISTFCVATCLEVWFVKPYEASMQSMYISHNIEATKYGFGLDNITQKEFPAENDLSTSDISENSAMIDNIRITDINQTNVSTNALQSLMSYYTFGDSDVIPINYNGKKTAISVSAREFDQKKLLQPSQSYINKKLRYTHGYGVVASSVNRTTSDGQPEFLIKDIPLVSEAGMPKITQPRIYFGEKNDDYAIVGTKHRELDYMDGDKSVEYTYSGSAGINLSLLNRFVFSVDKLDPMILLSGYITDESKLLTNRNILERVKKAAPFLTYDNDPYIIFGDDGTLKWIIDIYTTTSMYPYAQKYDGINYIRNSGKAIVDAYSGEITFYITDIYDPIINVFSRMYPGLFSYDPLPDYAVSQQRYPEYIFKIQSEVYKTYHTDDVDALYSNSDVWVNAKEKYSQDETVDVAPYYTIMNLSGQDDLVIMRPYTPQGKDNLIAWIAASSARDSYGKITAYKFPKGKTVYGTLHIENKIDNDPNISRDLSLWNQGDSKVVKGSLMVIPIKNSLLYIEPIYITSKNSAALPEIKRIIVAYDDKIAMEPSLREALYVLFGMKEPTISSGENEEISEDALIESIIAKYDEMNSHSAQNNYNDFGDTLNELGEKIEELRKMRNEKADGAEDKTN